MWRWLLWKITRHLTRKKIRGTYLPFICNQIILVCTKACLPIGFVIKVWFDILKKVKSISNILLDRLAVDNNFFLHWSLDENFYTFSLKNVTLMLKIIILQHSWFFLCNYSIRPSSLHCTIGLKGNHSAI